MTALNSRIGVRWWWAAGVLLAAPGVWWGVRQRAVPPAPVITERRAPTDADAQPLLDAARSRPDDPRPRLSLGSLFLAQGRPESAMEHLARAAEHPATAGAASVLLVDVAADSRQAGPALAAAQAAVAVAPGDPRAWEGLIRVLYRKGDTGPGSAALEEAVRRFPRDGRLRILRAEALAASGRNHEAAREYEAGLQTAPEAGAQLAFALLLGRMNAPERAKKAFQRAVELDPASATAFVGLARVNLELGMAAEAEQAAYTALQLAPEDPEAIFVLARSLMDDGQPESARTARELFQRILALQPQHLEAHYRLGVLELRAGNGKSAMRHLQEVLLKQPERLDARQNYAKALQLAKLKKEAAEQQALAGQLAEVEQRYSELARRLEIDPKNVGAHCDLGDFYLEHGAIPKAVQEYRRALQLDSRNQRAAAGLKRAEQASP